ncbi:unnamed protein product [Rotaria sp. Silwood2]|nr:unnamed protein product [Rotaria sp. Silwood2]CAF4619041.1 unnamed protein product [Rotaria sp. Silwood2]
MPHPPQRKSQTSAAASCRWVQEESSEMDVEEVDDIFDAIVDENDGFLKKLDYLIIGDLFELCKADCGSRRLSVLLYTLLRITGQSCRFTDDVLEKIGAFRRVHAHKWSEVFICGDFDTFTADGRGGKMFPSFYDDYPGLEVEAKAFAIEGCSRKNASFTVGDLAKFVDEKFYELTQTVKTGDDLIRFEKSCRLDLRRWGARFEPNSARPYFEGHERADVVIHRNEFISYFLQRKDEYYTISDGDQPKWISPTHNPRILIFHDESTFKSGEVSAKRWIMEDHTPFFSKGRGRSHMISDFLVQHPSGPFFSLSDAEFHNAVEKFPSLSAPSGLSYFNNSATAGINVGQEVYFNNETILAQFERLFMLLPFKEAFKDHIVEIIVDNAKTHSAKSYSINDFSKGIGTKCSVDSIEYTDDNGQLVSVSCYFSKGQHKGLSKGLVELARDLKVPISPSMKLPEIRTRLSTHSAFQNLSKLELLAKKYHVKVIFCPKFHCELNSIEGLWCDMKRYIRAYSDQTFSTMLRLIPESRASFEERKIQMKLFRRFWRSLHAYSQGQSYEEVLKLFFSHLCRSDVASHRKISNSKLS